MGKFHQIAAIYLNKKMLVIGALGFASGLPLLLTLSVLSYWLAKIGVDKTTIGLFALVSIPYSFKFCWSPIIDKVPLGIITKYFGQRRGWALLCQCILMLSIIALGQTDPHSHLEQTAILALIVAIASASQDIVIDAIRIEMLKENEQGAGAAMSVGGYRLGMLAAGGGSIILSDFINWDLIFFINSALVLIGVIAVLFADEYHQHIDKKQNFKQFMQYTIIEPFTDFFAKQGAVIILLFIVFYKYGDAFSGAMANPFYQEMGFSGLEIGATTKFMGLIMTLLGVFCGGIIVARFGIITALFLGGVFQALTNIFFVILANVGHDISLLNITIGTDNFTGGIGTAALVAYLSTLTNKHHTATQYAILSSFMASGRTILSSGSGFVASELGWTNFFILSIIMAIPALILLAIIKKYYDSNHHG